MWHSYHIKSVPLHPTTASPPKRKGLGIDRELRKESSEQNKGSSLSVTMRNTGFDLIIQL